MPRGQAPTAIPTLPLATLPDRVERQEGAAQGQSPLSRAFPGARPSVARRAAAEGAGRGGRKEAERLSGAERHAAAMAKVTLRSDRAGGAAPGNRVPAESGEASPRSARKGLHKNATSVAVTS